MKIKECKIHLKRIKSKRVKKFRGFKRIFNIIHMYSINNWSKNLFNEIELILSTSNDNSIISDTIDLRNDLLYFRDRFELTLLSLIFNRSVKLNSNCILKSKNCIGNHYYFIGQKSRRKLMIYVEYNIEDNTLYDIRTEEIRGNEYSFKLIYRNESNKI